MLFETFDLNCITSHLFRSSVVAVVSVAAAAAVAKTTVATARNGKTPSDGANMAGVRKICISTRCGATANWLSGRPTFAKKNIYFLNWRFDSRNKTLPWLSVQLSWDFLRIPIFKHLLRKNV
jgi:hypothetical protein